ncbi:MAG: hypothetical protein ACR2QT_09770 [Woeseiaceae bacterium]
MGSNRVSSIVAVAALSACAYEPEALNSERIENRFGSYGIEVLSHSAGIRRSSLYSYDDDQQICRTYAVVQFEDDSTPRVAEAHASVLAGQSIGATFKSTGWKIKKSTVHVGHLPSVEPSHSIGTLMQLKEPTDLGIHAYKLILEKDAQSMNYATIVETHHPEYLSVEELNSLYGDEVESHLDENEIGKLFMLVLNTD